MANNKPTKKLGSVKSNKTSSNGKSLVQDKRYIRTDTPSKGDKMFERAWEDTYENRKRRVG